MAEYHEVEESNTGTVEVTPGTSGLKLRPVPSPSVGVSSGRVIASSGLASAALTIHFSFPQPAQVSMVSATVAVRSTAPTGPPSPSNVKHSYVSRRLVYGVTDSEHLQGPMDLIREQREAVTGLAASRLAYLESVCNNSAVASATVSLHNLAVEGLQAENVRLCGES